MIRIFFVSLLLVFSQQLKADVITIGDERISVEPPIGFEAISPEMGQIYDLLKQFVPSTNIEFVHYVTKEDADLIRSGGEPLLERRFAIQTAKSLVDHRVSKSSFESIKTKVRQDNNAIIEKAKPQIDSELSSAAGRVAESTGVDMGFQNVQIRALPIHDETDRSISFSSLMDMDVTSEFGDENSSGVTTVSYAELSGKLVYVYVWGGSDDLEWSQAASKDWINQLLAANPSKQLTGFSATLSNLTNIDLSRVLAGAAGGAGVALLFALFSFVFSYFRRKSKSAD